MPEVAALMTDRPVTVSSQDLLGDVIHQVSGEGHDVYPVVAADGRTLGLLSLADAGRDPHACYATLVADLTDRDPGLLVAPDLDAELLLDAPSFLRVHHAVVVDRERNPIGIVAESDLLSPPATPAAYPRSSAPRRRSAGASGSAPAPAR